MVPLLKTSTRIHEDRRKERAARRTERRENQILGEWCTTRGMEESRRETGRLRQQQDTTCLHTFFLSSPSNTLIIFIF